VWPGAPIWVDGPWLQLGIPGNAPPPVPQSDSHHKSFEHTAGTTRSSPFRGGGNKNRRATTRQHSLGVRNTDPVNNDVLYGTVVCAGWRGFDRFHDRLGLFVEDNPKDGVVALQPRCCRRGHKKL
jgi:hypothetical protein